MSSAFEQFLAGEGPLARLIHDQTPFEAPAGMFERVIGALGTDDAALSFEPPPSLEAAVLAEAARLDVAQSGRRDALLDQLAAGADVSAVLGEPVSGSTARWLEQQARQRTVRTPPRRKRQAWFQGLGVAAMAVLAASVTLAIWFDPTAPTLSGSGAGTPPSAPIENHLGSSTHEPSRVTENALALRERAPAGAPARERDGLTAPHAARSAEAADMKRAQPETRVAKPSAPVAKLKLERPAPPPRSDGSIVAPAPAPSADAEVDAAASPPPRGDTLADAPEPTAAQIGPHTVEIPLDTPATTIATRLSASPPQTWVWQVHPDDAAQAGATRNAVLTALQGEGRADQIRLEITGGTRGWLSIHPGPPPASNGHP